MALTVHALRALKDNFIYVLAAPDGRCAVVDPGEAGPVRGFLENRNLKLELILCTHHHRDHVGAVEELARSAGCEVWASEIDGRAIRGVTRLVKEGEALSLFGEEMVILALPGHTHGQIAFHLPESTSVFVGDTLFSAGCGRLFEGTAEEMFNSLKKLARLAPRTRIYFGHEYTLRNLKFVAENRLAPANEIQKYESHVQALLAAGKNSTPSTVGQELLINPFLNVASAEAFKKLRLMRDSWN